MKRRTGGAGLLQTGLGAFKTASGSSDGQGAPPEPPPSQNAGNRPSGADAVLAEIAATILDGSVPFEEALKRAQEKLDAIDLETLSKPLEEALEAAMFDKAAEAVSKERKTK